MQVDTPSTGAPPSLRALRRLRWSNAVAALAHAAQAAVMVALALPAPRAP